MTQPLERIADVGDAPIAAEPQTDALVKVASQREITEAQGAMVLAQRFPRDESDARERILIACQRPGLAEGAMYTYARGGTDITGPSIRLAEAIAQAWGNLTFGIRELEQRHGESTMEAFAWDLERNVRQIKVFQVKHLRHARGKVYALETPRDIYETVANQGARRLRACILGLIPGDIVEAAVSECEKTLTAKADTSPEGVKKMLGAFEKYGVTKEQIEARLQRKLDAMTPAQMVGLMKIYTSLKDGMSVAAEWFDGRDENGAPQEAAGGNVRARESLQRQRQEAPREAKAPEGGDDVGPTPSEAPAASGGAQEPTEGGVEDPWEKEGPKPGETVEETLPLDDNPRPALLKDVDKQFTRLKIVGSKRKQTVTDWPGSTKGRDKPPTGVTDLTDEELPKFLAWLEAKPD